MPLDRFAAAQLGGTPLTDWCAALGGDVADLTRWRALTDVLLTAEGEKRKVVNVRNGFPKEAKAEKAAVMAVIEALTEHEVESLRALRTLPEPDADDDAVVRALITVLKLAAAELWLVFRENGEVDFSELSMRALEALGTVTAHEPSSEVPTDLALRLDYQIKHLLVDEFQDTSPAQVRLLEALTAGWQPGEREGERNGDGRTLFLVGDPMQSIYRFRKADVGLFLRVQERGIGDLPLQALRLSRNNRSDPQIVDWINQAFPTLFPAQDEAIRGQIRYRPFVATRPPAEGCAGVKSHPLFISADASRAAAREQEAQCLLDIIVAARKANPTQTVAVLLRARNHLSGLVASLRRQTDALAFSAVEVEPLLGRQCVQDLISLTWALHHRADRAHWLAILRAPWCGLTLADLHALAADDHEATIWQLMNDHAHVERLSPDGQRRLAHVRAVMAEALAGQGRQRRRSWVEDVWRKLGGEPCAGATGRADAAAFFARLDALDVQGRFVLDTLEADMSALYAAADVRSEGHIQLMTIHKSKGLEFDTVILPGLDRVGQGGDAPLLIWDEFPLPEGESLVAAPINARRGKAVAPTAYDYLRGLERERSANEDVRVLYVAATRAITVLHWVSVVHCDAAGLPETPRAGAALNRLWPAFADEIAQRAGNFSACLPGEQATERVADAADDLANFVPCLVRLATPPDISQWRAPVLSGESLATEASTTVDAFSAAVGTLVHACLEQVVRSGSLWDETRLNALMPALVGWLSSRGWSAEEAHAGAQRARHCLTQTLTSRDGQWVLAQHADGAAELAMSQVGAGETAISRVVDRCFIADGVRWVIDYKSADLGEAPDQQAFERHAQRYREQLADYARLFAQDGLPVRCAILYVAYGKLISLD